jgi:zinc/manganese transport system substrate-binding protein
MRLFRDLAVVALAALAVTPAHAAIRVVTATDTLAWATREIGGNHVQAEALSHGYQDPHQIEARPSQVVKLAQADLLVRIGMDLDLWFDPLIDAARNSKIARGERGYVDAHVGLHAVEVPSGKVDPANAATYRANYVALSGRLTEANQRWEAEMRPFHGKQIVTYHKTFPYLLARFGLEEFENVEPKPGIEPSAGHVVEVARAMKRSGVKVILTEDYRSRRFSDLLAHQSGGVVVPIPAGVGDKGVNDYFTLMNTIVGRLASGLR